MRMREVRSPMAAASTRGEGRIAVFAEMVFRQPDGIETERLRPGDLIEGVAVEPFEGNRTRRRISEVVPESEIHAAFAHESLRDRKSSNTEW